MKKFVIDTAIALATVLTASFTASCSKEGDKTPSAKPYVVLTEVGHDNSRHAHPGHDLHLEATITAEGLVSSIHIEIHQEDGGNYRIEKAYTSGKYTGIRNCLFHEHVDIPADAPLGNYHLHFTVTDSEGQQGTASSDLKLEEGDAEPDDDDHSSHE